MEAREFVKKFGWEHAVGFCRWATENKSISAPDDFKLNTAYGRISYLDLKTLVDAWELVGKFGGLDKAKFKVRLNGAAFIETEPRLKKAIALVESCDV